MTDSKIHLELGDIIEIKALGDPSINDKQFYINYIDSTEIEILDNIEGKSIVLKLTPDGSFENESISEIDLLDRASEIGYARQNSLLPNTWVNIYLGGDIPTTIIGKITNLEEDQIEVSVWNSETKGFESEPLYLDFAYKGIPRDIPIENIDIREAPPAETLAQDKDDQEPRYEETTTVEVLDTDKQGEQEELETETEVKEQIRDLIFEADQIVFGEDLDVIAHEVEIDEDKKKFSISMQTSDLLDDLLSNIPNSKRSTPVMNNIHKMIERYKQLRNDFSEFDSYDLVVSSKTNGKDHKPLVSVLHDFTHDVMWMLPVSKIKKKLYDIEGFQDEVDVDSLDLATARIDESNLVDSYLQNDIGGDSKYVSLIKGLQKYYTPYEEPVSQENVITTKNINTSITSVINNFGNFDASVSHNDDIKMKRYFIQKYITGAKNLQYTKTKRGEINVNINNITSGDSLSLTSLLVLPDAIFDFSRIGLPQSTILQKANLNSNYLNYWQIFSKNREITSTIIDNIGKEHDHNKRFMKHITEYSLDDSIQEPDSYKQFLQTVIPNTAEILETVKDKISDCLSIRSVLQFIEPFMVYQKDLTLEPYKLIVNKVIENINDFKKKYLKNQERTSRIISKFYNSEEKNLPYLLLLLNQELYDMFQKEYQFGVSSFKQLSNSSFLDHIIHLDHGRFFHTLVAKSTTSLMIPAGAEQIKKLEEFYKETDKTTRKTGTTALETSEDLATDTGDDADQDSKSVSDTEITTQKDCSKYVLAKRYFSVEQLEADNDKTIYFDKEFDKTYYDLIEESTYKSAISSKNSDDENIQELSVKLIENIGLKPDIAVRDAKALLRGKKEVENGDYCVLVINSGKESKSLYYIRKDGKWENDSTISSDVFADTTKDFCNLTEKCLIVKNNCESLKDSETQLKNKNLLQLISEFDSNLYSSQADITTKIDSLLEIYRQRLPKLVNLERKDKNKYNDQKFYLGGMIEIIDQVESPHIGLRDKILGLADFSQRQNFICQFTVKFTRPAYDGEDKWWKYCNDTNTKLLPTFIYDMADAYVNDDNYIERVENICKDQGKLSDDGEAWVDKYSGYFIRYIEFDTEEGYDDGGFKKVSREILEKENEGFLAVGKQIKKEASPDTIKIKNVIVAMAGYMGLNIDPYVEDIVKDTMIVLQKHAPQKSDNEKKKKADYVKKYNTILTLVSLGFLFIYIQTSIPSLQTRKRFPGCKRSFSGYPMYGVEDVSGLEYIACVASKISKSGSEPWNSISRQKKEKLLDLLKKIMDTYIVQTDIVKRKIHNKLKYLRENPEDNIPKELDIRKWINFLPPLVSIELKKTENISKVFRDGLQSEIKNGKMEQFEKILVMQSKIIYFSLDIQEQINSVVKKNTALLQNNNGEPYLENSCCDVGTTNTIRYFKEKSKQISTYNKVVAELSDLVMTLEDMAKATILFYDNNTKPVYPPLLNEFSEETIYRAFITYCKFNTNLPMDPELQTVCLEKPDNFDMQDSIEEKIDKLKRSGKRYGQRELQDLLFIINQKNIVKVKLNYTAISDIEKLRGVIEHSAKIDSATFPEKFRLLLLDYIDRFDIENISNEIPEELLNYLDVANRQMMDVIKSFLVRNLQNKKDKTTIINTIENITDFKRIEREGIISGLDDNTFNIVEFIKNTLRFICEVYPNIVSNKVDPCSNDCKIPKHWNLSDYHNNDLVNILNNYYKNFKSLMNNDETVHYIFDNILEKNKEIYMYAKYTKYYAPIKNKTTYVQSIFSSDLIVQVFKYYFYSALLNIVNSVEGDGILEKEGDEPTPEAFKLLIEAEESDPTVGESVIEDQIIEGEKESVNNKASNIIYVLMKTVMNSKKVIDFNYNSVREKVDKSKEQEKIDITDYLKEMTEEEREIENIFKTNKLEKWSKGIQKGFRTYQGETYDQEREQMEAKAVLDRKLEKKNYVTELNKDIYRMDQLEEEARANEIEAEVYSMQDLPNDDDYGDRDGDEYY